MSNPNTGPTIIGSAAGLRASGLVLRPRDLGYRGRHLRLLSLPFVVFARWIAKSQTARTRRAALSGLLELDRARLDDLGISRDDLIKAMAASAQGGSILHSARARNSRV